MKKANNKAVWVAQAWQNCPYDEMIENIPVGDILVLDLFSESRPQWGDPESLWYRKNGFGKHGWIYCMILNFGGNVGLHGKMSHVIDEFYKAKSTCFGQTLKGIGMTMEGTENNPVMYELLCELPWRKECFSKDKWLTEYIKARYGKYDKRVNEAWILLSNGIYNCPAESTQQGTHESIFCARPSLNAYQVSSWSEMNDYYNPKDVIKAAGLMIEAADKFKGNDNFEYDLIDIVRQAVAEKGRLVYPVVVSAYKSGDIRLFREASARFLELISIQDCLLSSRKEFRVGTWINMARKMGNDDSEKKWLEWNARVQITTWGDRHAADVGGLRDYAHKEWNGILKDLYYIRWKRYFEYLEAKMKGLNPPEIDYYGIEEKWTLATDSYSDESEGNAVSKAIDTYKKIVF